MIAKITRGSDAAGLARYLHGPGRSNEHVYVRDGRTFSGGLVIGGTVPVVDDRDGSGWARAFKLAHAGRPRVQKNVWQCSLRTHADDRRLSDAEWGAVADQLAERLGFAEHPYVVVRHADDHVHVAVSRVSDDCKVWKGAHDFRAVRPVMRAAEQRYGLIEVPDYQQAPGPKTGLTQGEERRARRTAEVPIRADLAMNVRTAVDLSAGAGREGFEAQLDRAGILYRANVASTGRVNGYSFAHPKRLDGDGQPVWFSASKLDRGLSWSKLAPLLDGPAVAVDRRERIRALRQEKQQHTVFWNPDVVVEEPVRASAGGGERSSAAVSAAGGFQVPAEGVAARAARLARRGTAQVSPTRKASPQTQQTPRRRPSTPPEQDQRRGIGGR